MHRRAVPVKVNAIPSVVTASVIPQLCGVRRKLSIKSGDSGHRWTKEGLWILSIWTSLKPLTWSPATSFSLHWRDMDLTGGLFGG